MGSSQSITEGSDNPVAINVTAMVDVIFCLCIFFMCSFHFKQVEGKLDTWLPKSGEGIFSDKAPVLFKKEIRLVMTWDKAARASIRRVENHPAAPSDDDLLRAVLEAAHDHDHAVHTDWPLVINASADVPWEDVVHVMDLCKQNHMERMELAAPLGSTK